MRLAAVIGVLAGCAREAPPPDPSPPEAAAPPADSLVLTARGVEVWLTEGREAADSTGRACYERSVELRTDSTRIKVPLLFVTAAPVPLDAAALRAELSLRCRTIAIYRVDLATGRPVKIEDR